MAGNDNSASTRGSLGGAGMAPVEEAGSHPDRADARSSGRRAPVRKDTEIEMFGEGEKREVRVRK